MILGNYIAHDIYIDYPYFIIYSKKEGKIYLYKNQLLLKKINVDNEILSAKVDKFGKISVIESDGEVLTFLRFMIIQERSFLKKSMEIYSI